MPTSNPLRPWAQHKGFASGNGEAHEMMVVDPRTMLARQAPARRRSGPGALFWLIVFLIVALNLPGRVQAGPDCR